MTIKPSYELYRIPSKDLIETEKVSNKLENNKLENQHQRQSNRKSKRFRMKKCPFPVKKHSIFLISIIILYLN